ncbi:unnamed protein product [Gongylonema pulchrum]|uniref:E3 ubiquitin-protein ligase n=1 Tax=Gongylonema pulchrum TaxID=637853 RepID=A0A183DT33_9BILA|nr:unnamed protein product [Gongylonema pulchrum]
MCQQMIAKPLFSCTEIHFLLSQHSIAQTHNCTCKSCLDGEVPVRECPLDRFLTDTLPVDIDDACVPSLVLLRCLYALNRFWWTLFDDEEVPPTSHAPLLSSTAFHSSKLNAKVGRQLSDFLSVATQQIPKWIGDLIKAVPFIFTFSSRRNYLYCTAFGRDRALMHLVNQTDGGQADGESGRLTPRLERRKVSLDIPLNPVFFKWLCGDDKVFGLDDLEIFDKYLYQSLRALILTDPDDFNSLEQVRLFVIIKVV